MHWINTGWLVRKLTNEEAVAIQKRENGDPELSLFKYCIYLERIPDLLITCEVWEKENQNNYMILSNQKYNIWGWNKAFCFGHEVWDVETRHPDRNLHMYLNLEFERERANNMDRNIN